MNGFVELKNAIRRYIVSGKLEQNVLKFLWQNIKLAPTDYISVVKMLVDSGVIFLSSFNNAREDIERYHVVLYRLPSHPDTSLLEKAWPTECPTNQKQIELRFDLNAGCPPCLAARFAAKVHSLGHCSYAWENGAVVVTTDSIIRANQEPSCDANQGNDYLLVAIRTEVGLGEEEKTLFMNCWNL